MVLCGSFRVDGSSGTWWPPSIILLRHMVLTLGLLELCVVILF